MTLPNPSHDTREAQVRDWIGGCLALHGFREDCPACVAYRDANAALDSLVGELEKSREDFNGLSTENKELVDKLDTLREALEGAAEFIESVTEWIGSSGEERAEALDEIDRVLAAGSRVDTK